MSWVTVWVVVEAPLPSIGVQAPQALFPSLRRNFQRVIELLPGSVQVRTTRVSPAFAARAGLAGIRVAEASSDAGPSAPTFIARTWKP